MVLFSRTRIDHPKLSSAVFISSLLGGFRLVSLLERQLECIGFFLTGDTVTVACDIWVSREYFAVLLMLG